MNSPSKLTFSIVTIAYLILLIVVSSYWFYRGKRDVWIMENKVYLGNLIDFELDHPNESSDLREFLKARFYYTSNRLPDNWRSAKDYGAVSTSLTNLTIGKGPTSANEEYRLYQEYLTRKGFNGQKLKPAN